MINNAGAEFGAALTKNIRQYHNVAEFERSPAALDTTYLYPNPNVYPEKWHLREGEKPYDYARRPTEERCMVSAMRYLLFPPR